MTKRGDLVTARGFVLAVEDGIAAVAFPGQLVLFAVTALEAAPPGPADLAAYAAALAPAFLDMLQDREG